MCLHQKYQQLRPRARVRYHAPEAAEEGTRKARKAARKETCRRRDV